MPSLEIRYVKRQVRRRMKRSGSIWERIYWYYRRPGAPDDGKRLPGEPGSAGFAAALELFNGRAAACAAMAPAATFAGLVDRYKAAPEFTRLAEKTRKDYAKILAGLVERIGQLPYAAIDKEVVYAVRDRHAAAPHWANYHLRVLRLLLAWAADRELIAGNPAKGVKALKVKPRRSVWSIEAETAFMAKASPMMRLAYLLGIYTAQREADVLAMTWAQIKAGRFHVRQAKTDALVSAPVHRVLAAALDDRAMWVIGHRKDKRIVATTVLVSKRGLPFRADHFRHAWRKATLAAGLDGLQFRDLRRTAMVRLSEAGATTQEIAAVSGHDIAETQRILDTYIPRTPAMADAAMRKLQLHDENAEGVKLGNIRR